MTLVVGARSAGQEAIAGRSVFTVTVSSLLLGTSSRSGSPGHPELPQVTIAILPTPAHSASSGGRAFPPLGRPKKWRTSHGGLLGDPQPPTTSVTNVPASRQTPRLFMCVIRQIRHPSFPTCVDPASKNRPPQRIEAGGTRRAANLIGWRRGGQRHRSPLRRGCPATQPRRQPTGDKGRRWRGAPRRQDPIRSRPVRTTPCTAGSDRPLLRVRSDTAHTTQAPRHTAAPDGGR